MPRRKGTTKLVAQRNASRALEMHLSGATETQIAKALGYQNPKSIYRVVREELARVRATQAAIEDHLTAQLLRCKRMLMTQWKGVQEGDQSAIILSLRIMEKIDLYSGLAGVPVKFGGEGASTGPATSISGGTVFVIGGPPAEYNNKLNEMAVQAGLPPAPDLSHLDGKGPVIDVEATDLEPHTNGNHPVTAQNGAVTPEPPQPPQPAEQAQEAQERDGGAEEQTRLECTVFVRPMTGEDECRTCNRPKDEH